MRNIILTLFPTFVTMHRGEIVENAVRESGVKLSYIADRLKISRRHMYNLFERHDLDYETILSIGAIIHYDFGEKFPSLKKNFSSVDPKSTDSKVVVEKLKAEISHWKNKYITLLEEHTKLLGKVKVEAKTTKGK